MAKSRKADKVDAECLLAVQVIPRSSRVAILFQPPDLLKVKLTSPPVEGAANRQLIDTLAKKLSIPRRNIEIIGGETSRMKRIKILGLSPAEARDRLEQE